MLTPPGSSSKLQELYPDHSLVVTADWKLDLLQFPDALTALIPGKKFLSHAVFVPFARRTGHAGVVAKDVFYGVFRLAWKDYEYTVYIVQVQVIRPLHLLKSDHPFVVATRLRLPKATLYPPRG